MRKLLAAAVACVLILTMIIPSVATAAVDYSYIKVKLVSMGSPASVQFKVAGAYRISEASNVDLFPGITYTIKPEGTGQKLTYNNGVGNVAITLPASATFVQYSNGSTNNFLYVNNPGYGWRYYSGNMTFSHPGGTGYLQLINTVFIETYLYGVVAYEMGDNWPAEALKAQAICARTYAMNGIRSNPGGAYHLVDTSSDQVYRGYPYNSNGITMKNVINAVDATRGKAIVCGDPALLTFADGAFSASNGGQVRTASMRHGSSVDTYHVFKDDPYDLANPSSPYFTFIFPTSTNTSTMSLLGDGDKAKANSMLALLAEKLPAELLAQKGIACTAADITINGITSATPAELRPGMPSGSKEFTKVAVTVNVTVNGVAAPQPKASVTGNGVIIASGSTTPSTADDTDFGSTNVGGATTGKTFTITNTGNAALNISGITISGNNASEFSIGLPQPAIVAVGSNAEFTVNFAPSATGTRTATVSIKSDDAGSPYVFAIQGTGSDSSTSIAPNNPGGSLSTGSLMGGGGMPVSSTYDITINLTYICQGTNGEWDSPGELRTGFSSYSSLLGSSYLWLLYQGASPDGKFLYVTTRGYGHGVGLSQRGAQQMANTGKDYLFIIDFYFNTGIGKSSITSVPITLKPLSQLPAKGGAKDSYGKVTASSLKVRAAANTKATVVATLTRNTVMQILDATGSWYRILYTSKGIVGFVSSAYIKKTTVTPKPSSMATPVATPTPTPSSPTVSPSPTAQAPLLGRVLSSTLNIRSQANTTCTILYTLKNNDVVTILDVNAAANWYKVKYASYVGYCMYQSGTTVYIEIIGTSPTATATPTATSGPTTLKPVTAKANVTGYLAIRSSASTSSSKVGQIPGNALFTVVQVAAAPSWLKITYLGKTGYVLARYSIIGGKSAYRACTVTISQLNVRSGAGLSYAIIGNIKSGNTVIVTAKVTTSSGTWYKIIFGSITGYIDSRYARISTT